MRINSLVATCFVFALMGSGRSQEMKFFGCIWQRGTPDANFAEYFNQVTPENAGKWGNVDYNQLDQMFEYAEENNMKTKQHTFVWGQQTRNGATMQEVEDWISGFMERYPQVDMIDVVNEALPGHAQPDYKDNLGGDGETGWDWVLWTFETTRRYAPNAKLLINDYGILNSSRATEQYYDFIEVIQTGGNIDGIGCQAHFLENTSPTLVKQNLDRLAELGLPIYISEFELAISNDQQQLSQMQEIFPVLWEHPMVAGVTLWGYEEGTMWRGDGWLVQQNGTERPAMTWLKQYLEENPLPAPGSEVPVIGLKRRSPESFTRILFSDQIRDINLGNEAKLYTLDGKLIADVTNAFDKGTKSRIPVVIREKTGTGN